MALRITLGYYVGQVEPYLGRFASAFPWDEAVERSYYCARRRMLFSQSMTVIWHSVLLLLLSLAQIALAGGALAANLCALAWTSPEYDAWNVLLGAVVLLVAISACLLIFKLQERTWGNLRQALEEFQRLRDARLSEEDLNLLGQLLPKKGLEEAEGRSLG
jgi:hypothetical protein